MDNSKSLGLTKSLTSFTIVMSLSTKDFVIGRKKSLRITWYSEDDHYIFVYLSIEFRKKRREKTKERKQIAKVF